MTREKIIRPTALLAAAVVGLIGLVVAPAEAAPAATAMPVLAMIQVGENPDRPANPVCGETGTAIGVDSSGNLVQAGYTVSEEFDCSLIDGGPSPVLSGLGHVTSLFADAVSDSDTATTIFTIDSAGDLTAYGFSWAGTSETLSAGTVIGTGWNAFTHVTYAGNGVFYAVERNGDLAWYRDLDVAGRTADWANGGIGAVIGTQWQHFPLVFASGGAVYASTTAGSLLWYGYSNPTSAHGTWSANSGAVIGSGWGSVVTATANAGTVAGHVLIHTVTPDGEIHFYDHFAADTGAASWSSDSGVALQTNWTD